MSNNPQLSDLESNFTKFLPGHSVDCVIVGYKNEELKVLLVQWKNTEMWGLPGGFIYQDEDLDKAAGRVLKERTGLEFSFLSQFYTFGDFRRRDSGHIRQLLGSLQINSPAINQWFSQRFITTGYVALVNINACDKPEPDFISNRCEWVPVKKIPDLIFDHRDIIEKAFEHLRVRINYLPLGRTLLPAVFTMRELQRLYEAVLEKKLDRGNFQRKMLKLGILIRLNKKPDAGAHKAPYLYRFDHVRYEELNRKGIGFNLLSANNKQN